MSRKHYEIPVINLCFYCVVSFQGINHKVMLRGKLCAFEEDSRDGWVGHQSSDGVRGDGGSGQGQGRGGYDRREQKMCRLTNYSFCRCQRQW